MDDGSKLGFAPDDEAANGVHGDLQDLRDYGQYNSQTYINLQLFAKALYRKLGWGWLPINPKPNGKKC